VELQRFLWLFFSFSGRLNRPAFALAGLLLYLIRAYPIYWMAIAMANGDQEMYLYWFDILLMIFGVLLWSHLALSAKRLHDWGYTGWWGLLFLIADLFFFVLLCMPKGMPGPNRYGRYTNAPAQE
jgi:uncharacterized membrane protein YhaH (DUF805 family)